MENAEKHQGGGAEASGALCKSIGLTDAIAMVIGMVIGSGIFFKASVVYGFAGSELMGVMAWAIGGVITLAAALTVAEVGAAIPETGGVFAYLKTLYNEKLAFLFGWMQSVVYVPGVSAALAIIFVTQASVFIDLTPFQQKLLAIGVIYFLIGINILSTKLGGKLQVITTLAKLIPIAVILFAGFKSGKAGAIAHMTVGGQGASVGIAGFGAAILGTLWAYDGWINVGNMSGEMKNPKRDVPRSIILGLLLVVVVYIAFNIAMVNTLPMSEIILSKKAASDAATLLFGKNGAAIVAVGIMISIFGTLNGYVLTGTRIPYAMAKQQMLPFSSQLSKINKQTGTPINSLLLIGGLATLYVFSGSFETLTNLVTFASWIFFVMTVYGVFILRKRRVGASDGYKVPLFPFVPLVGILGGLYILGSTLVTDTQNALIGIGITLLGLPVLMFLRSRQFAAADLTESDVRLKTQE